MRAAHAVADVRTAEHALMALVPDGALMQRAAAGLASACARLLGRVYGSRVVVLAGTGDNGGDALFAGARLASRGALVTAVAAGPGLHAAGAAALREAGGRLTRTEQAGSGPAGSGPAGSGPAGHRRHPGHRRARRAARARRHAGGADRAGRGGRSLRRRR